MRPVTPSAAARHAAILDWLAAHAVIVEWNPPRWAICIDDEREPKRG